MIRDTKACLLQLNLFFLIFADYVCTYIAAGELLSPFVGATPLSTL